MKKEFLEGGKVCNAHGVRGVLKTESWCDSPKVLAGQRRVFFTDGKGGYIERKVLGASVNGAGVLLTLDGVDSYDKAIALKNTIIYLRREDIPLDDGAMFIVDMIGLPVIDKNTGRVYGEISAVNDVPRGRLYTIKTNTGEVLLPHADVFVKEIDAERGMFITPIPGFFDNADEV